MALTNPRPLAINSNGNEILHNNACPVFQASSLVLGPNADKSAQAEPVGTIPGTPDSEETYSNGGNGAVSDSSTLRPSPHKELTPLDLSKIIPVTGERPMPKDRTSPLDDDVLYAVFVILWEKDPSLQGMTVKQLSDHLLEKHPDMNNLSTKLSNLISAKLNAYVKKLEKGEKTLIYALSREWSNSSPRRMVYVYRGILSPDYKRHAQAAALITSTNKKHERDQTVRNDEPDSSEKSGKNSSEKLAPTRNGDDNINSSINHNGNNGNTYNIKKVSVSNAFTPTTEFNVPYLTSPVSVGLTPDAINGSNERRGGLTGVTNNYPRKRFHIEESDDQSVKKFKSGQSSTIPHNNTGMNGQSNDYVTAAAAAPRISKFFTRNGFKTTPTTSNATGIMTAIHNVIYTQNPIESTKLSKLKNYQNSLFSATWLKTVRDGFLANDIESPESISFDDLEGILNQP